jgi:hypothetical protein
LGAVQVLTQASVWQNGVEPAHARPHLPQLFGSLSSDRHCPSQLEVSGGQEHAPFVHAWPPAHASPHVPQFNGSVPTKTHAWPQLV